MKSDKSRKRFAARSLLFRFLEILLFGKFFQQKH